MPDVQQLAFAAVASAPPPVATAHRDPRREGRSIGRISADTSVDRGGVYAPGPVLMELRINARGAVIHPAAQRCGKRP